MATISKDMRGNWRAETRLAFADSSDRLLQVVTCKSHAGGFYTFAQAVKREHGGFSFVMYQDFRETIGRSAAARCTQKAVTAFHASHDLDAVMTRAKAFYADRGR